MSSQVNSCGRWAILRILSAINQGMNLAQFHRMVKSLKNPNFTLDEADSAIINIKN
jgi:hypothetical protein